MFVFDILLFCLEVAIGILMILGLVIGIPFLILFAIRYFKWRIRKEKNV